jgi:heme exporter protein C
MNQRVYTGLLVVGAVMFAVAPVLIAQAPYESTMGLVQKIFYFHVPAWITMFVAIFTCGIASAVYLFKESPRADRIAVSSAEVAVMLGLIGLTTGPLWAIKTWGVWWQWDARLTMALILELIMLSYILVRQYGGPGSEKLAAALGIFAVANVPFVYVSVNVWRTIHPTTDVVPSLPTSAPGMFWPFMWTMVSYLVLFVLLVGVRMRLEEQRADVDRLHLALDEAEA